MTRNIDNHCYEIHFTDIIGERHTVAGLSGVFDARSAFVAAIEAEGLSLDGGDIIPESATIFMRSKSKRWTVDAGGNVHEVYISNALILKSGLFGNNEARIKKIVTSLNKAEKNALMRK